jgi:hypothetical protein
MKKPKARGKKKNLLQEVFQFEQGINFQFEQGIREGIRQERQRIREEIEKIFDETEKGHFDEGFESSLMPIHHSDFIKMKEYILALLTKENPQNEPPIKRPSRDNRK